MKGTEQAFCAYFYVKNYGQFVDMGIGLEAENGTKRLLSAGVPSNVHTLHIMPLSVMVFFLPAIAGRLG